MQRCVAVLKKGGRCSFKGVYWKRPGFIGGYCCMRHFKDYTAKLGSWVGETDEAKPYMGLGGSHDSD